MKRLLTLHSSLLTLVLLSACATTSTTPPPAPQPPQDRLGQVAELAAFDTAVILIARDPANRALVQRAVQILDASATVPLSTNGMTLRQVIGLIPFDYLKSVEGQMIIGTAEILFADEIDRLKFDPIAQATLLRAVSDRIRAGLTRALAASPPSNP